VLALLCAHLAVAHETRQGVTGARLVARAAADGKPARFKAVLTSDVPAFTNHMPWEGSGAWFAVAAEHDGGLVGTGRLAIDYSRSGKFETEGRHRIRFQGRKNSLGIRSVTFRRKRLVILAGGPSWQWLPDGTEDAVWVYFGLDGETFCARFGGTVTQHGPGIMKATAAAAPSDGCPALCGNGVHELGEACDDGNFDETDGCTSACTPAVCVGETFSSTFEAIQELVFERQGCTDALCHGAAPGAGGLDLSAGNAWSNLHEVPASGSGYPRVAPGAPRNSALYLKLLKGLDPDATDIPGDAMPSGGPPLPAELVEAVRRWIEQAAPASGTAPGTPALLGGCFPDPDPISIAPLPPPDPSEGVQLTMPPYTLAPQSESEVCFATYYDFSDVVPAEHQDPTGEFFYSGGRVTRQDPHSHHLAILAAGVPVDQVDHAGFGGWSCAGGTRAGETCDPLDGASCDGGICRSAIEDALACIGFGPPGGATAQGARNFLGGSGAGSASFLQKPGLYAKVPIRSFVYWNAHAFNLTTKPHDLQAWLNHYFAGDRRVELLPFNYIANLGVATGQAPYTRQTYCKPFVLPHRARLTTLTSHTHERGEAFWVEDARGNRIYESYTYADPVVAEYDPPLAFDAFDPAARTLTYCATYNNGVAADGSPDPTTVRRASTTPPNGVRCAPRACTSGRIGEPCPTYNGDPSCDTSPGGRDGKCDACEITGGVTTQDEMFVLSGWYYLEP